MAISSWLNPKKIINAARAAVVEVGEGRVVRAHTERLQRKLQENLPLYASDFSRVDFVTLSNSRVDYRNNSPAISTNATFRGTLQAGGTVDMTIYIDTGSAIRYGWPNSLKGALRDAVAAHDKQRGFDQEAANKSLQQYLDLRNARQRVVRALKANPAAPV